MTWRRNATADDGPYMEPSLPSAKVAKPSARDVVLHVGWYWPATDGALGAESEGRTVLVVDIEAGATTSRGCCPKSDNA